MNKPLKARSSVSSARTYFILNTGKHVLPGTERSSGLRDVVVERSDSGDRAETGRLQDHLVLPLLASKCTIRAVSVHASDERGGGCRRVHGGVYMGGVYIARVHPSY